MEILDALILGIVEGLTEFLPISSTGHLILASDLLGANDERGKVFDIAIQTGAVVAVIWEYRARLFRVDPKLWLNLIVAFIPAAVLGLAAAFVSAFVVIRWLIRYVATHDFRPFAWYRIVFGAVVLLTAYFGWVSWRA